MEVTKQTVEDNKTVNTEHEQEAHVPTGEELTSLNEGKEEMLNLNVELMENKLNNDNLSSIVTESQNEHRENTSSNRLGKRVIIFPKNKYQLGNYYYVINN